MNIKALGKLVLFIIFFLKLITNFATAQIVPSKSQVTREEFGEALGRTALIIIPQIPPASSSSHDILIAKSNRMLCIFSIVKELDKELKIFSVDGEAQLIGVIREKIKRFVPAKVEQRLEGKCLSLAKGSLGIMVKNTLVLIEDQKKFEATKEVQANQTEKKSSKTEVKQLLDILGLVAGQSSKDDVRKISQEKEFQYTCNPICLTVGGFDLTCKDEYDQKEILTTLTCWFGEQFNTKITNIEIFNILEDGFTRKFGKPKVRLQFQTQNVLGAKFDVVNPKWQDEKGNTLEMSSRAGKIDLGAFALKSGEVNLDTLLENSKKELNRKF